MTKSLAFLAVGALTAAVAQGVPARVLDTPEREIRHAFTEVAAIRELPDGRVLVLDTQEEIVVVADFNAGSVRQIGRAGSGPAEYRLPARLLALGAGVTGLVDGGNRRILRIDAAGEVGPFERAPERLRDARIVGAYASDTNAGFYRPVEPVRVFPDGRTALADSVAIERIDAVTGTVDSAGFMRLNDDFARTLAPGQRIVRVRPRARPLAFASSDDWTVSPDGRVAVASVEPFRITYFHDGERTDGPALPFERVPISDKDKALWLSSRRRPQQVIIQKGRDGPRYRAMAPAPMSESPVDFPPFFPPFVPGALRFAPDGRLWIQRSVPADSLPRYDVVDQRGHLVQRVVLPPRTRLIGFGTRWIYLVRTDPDDLQYVQRYPL